VTRTLPDLEAYVRVDGTRKMAGALAPATHNTYDLGTSSVWWQDTYSVYFHGTGVRLNNGLIWCDAGKYLWFRTGGAAGPVVAKMTDDDTFEIPLAGDITFLDDKKQSFINTSDSKKSVVMFTDGYPFDFYVTDLDGTPDRNPFYYVYAQDRMEYNCDLKIVAPYKISAIDGALSLPKDRPAVPTANLCRYDAATDTFEIYDGSSWNPH
jgi:hypothetical protein